MAPGIDEYVLTVPETARALKVSVHTVQRLIDHGDLPVLRIGRRVLVSRVELSAWVSANHAASFPGRRP